MRRGYIDARRVQGFSFKGALGKDGMKLGISDIGTPATGYNRGIYMDYQQNGIKTGSAEVNCLGIDLALKKAVPYAYNISLYMSSSGNPVLGWPCPISIYMDDLGTNAGQLGCIDMGIAQDNAISGRFCFMRMRAHGSQTPTDGMRFEGAHPCTNLVDFEVDATPVITAAVSGNQDKKIRVKVAALTRYIPLYDT